MLQTNDNQFIEKYTQSFLPLNILHWSFLKNSKLPLPLMRQLKTTNTFFLSLKQNSSHEYVCVFEIHSRRHALNVIELFRLRHKSSMLVHQMTFPSKNYFNRIHFSFPYKRRLYVGGWKIYYYQITKHFVTNARKLVTTTGRNMVFSAKIFSKKLPITF